MPKPLLAHLNGCNFPELSPMSLEGLSPHGRVRPAPRRPRPALGPARRRVGTRGGLGRGHLGRSLTTLTPPGPKHQSWGCSRSPDVSHCLLTQHTSSTKRIVNPLPVSRLEPRCPNFPSRDSRFLSRWAWDVCYDKAVPARTSSTFCCLGAQKL